MLANSRYVKTLKSKPSRGGVRQHRAREWARHPCGATRAVAGIRRYVAGGPQRRLEHPLPAQALRHVVVGYAEILPGVLTCSAQGDRGVCSPLDESPARGMRGQPAQSPPVARRVRAVVCEQPAVARHAQASVRGSALESLFKLASQRDFELALA